jgi:phosphohistidine phosphatase
MKNLILIRHAKSSWDDALLTDRERTLNKRGKQDAPVMGQLLNEKGLNPNRILSSPAKRALKTAKLIAEEIGYPKKKIDIREEIYEQGQEELVQLIAGLDNDWDRVFLIGHNPVLTEVANRLIDVGGIENMPTCGVVSVEFSNQRWCDCVKEGGKLAFFERPPKAKVDAIPES